MPVSLGVDVSALGVAEYYRGLAKTLVLDRADAALEPAVQAAGMRAVPTGVRNHVGFQRVAVIGGQPRRTGSVDHDPYRTISNFRLFVVRYH